MSSKSPPSAARASAWAQTPVGAYKRLAPRVPGGVLFGPFFKRGGEHPAPRAKSRVPPSSGDGLLGPADGQPPLELGRCPGQEAALLPG